MEYAEQFQKLEELLKAHNPDVDLTMLEKAFALASEKHKDQKRKSGEPFIIHPVAVATMLAEMDMDMPSVIAGMLHDVVEDTSVTIEEIREIFGDEIAYLVDGVTKLKRIPTSTKEELQNENLRKMFLSMASDIRVIVIKLVDRLHNMRTLQYVNTDAQITKARETLEIYTPLAHRLGMTKIKWELEDLCFKYLEPEAYNSLVTQITQRRDQQEAYIRKVLDAIRIRLDEAGIKAFLDGRPKHFYSIHKKMIAQNKALNQIYDLLAIRVIVDTVQECYTVLGIIHEMYTPMPGRFIASAVLDALWARCEALLTDYHAKNPLHAGIRAAELRQRLFHTVEPERADALLTLFVREGKLRFAAERYALADFTVRYTRRQTALRAELLALYRAADLRPERTDRVLARFDAKDRAEAERVLESLLTGGELIALAPRLCLHREVYVCACALVRAYFADHETLTLAAFRDLLGTSRDSALLVLECLDRNDRTRREGDLRRPGRRLYE